MKLAAFVAVAEEGGYSAASRRLHVTQPAVSQTVRSLERRLGVQLVLRSSTGVVLTRPGLALLAEARAILARHDELLQRMASYTTQGGDGIRLGVPIELAPDLLPGVLVEFAARCPEVRVRPLLLSTASQIAAVGDRRLDVGLVRERPAGPAFDAMLVVRESLGVLTAADLAARLVSPDGIRLDALRGLEWVGFPRSGSPAWYDELTAVLRCHGIEPGIAARGELTGAVKIAAVSTGHAFALAPQQWEHPIPSNVAWSRLAGDPLVRRTWVIWSANSHRRDIGHLITAFKSPVDP